MTKVNSFRYDINGLRAIAVIAVVLFHFESSWISGGFAGVDVFFVISGFLMTRIIFKGLKEENFSIWKFYIARANRIIPALAALCLVLLTLGWFYLSPLDYRELGKHVSSSLSFSSNIIYWMESGYFDADSHEKWLLHTWSLSVEWQFYFIYPLILVVLRKFMPVQAMKKYILIGALLGFIFSAMTTYQWPNQAYYLLPARAWEMMVGGVAFLYPFSLKEQYKKYLEWLGLILIIISYFFISKNNPWPGYLAIIPVLGSFFIIQAQRNNSLITNNLVFQKLGSWSYSIYLWHWPFVVAIYYLSLNESFIYVGIAISVLLGFLSNKYIEKIKFKDVFGRWNTYFQCKPIYMVLGGSVLGLIIFTQNGFIKLAPNDYQALINNAKPSPYRDKCHIAEYQDPKESCEYFGDNITWATFGDSHAVEISYALAEKLKTNGVGLKQFTFSGCIPSYQEAPNLRCSKWYNETIDYILKDKKIRNVVFNHRFTNGLLGGDAAQYPIHDSSVITDKAIRKFKKLDELIDLFAEGKDNVYIFYPIPELQRNINQLIGSTYLKNNNINNILGTSVDWYIERNKYVIKHFRQASYPANVHLIRSQDAFCDEVNCYAVKEGVPLYFDDDHPSIIGAEKLINLMVDH